MSMYAEYRNGSIDYDEFMCDAQWEERKDRDYLEHQFDKTIDNYDEDAEEDE